MKERKQKIYEMLAADHQEKEAMENDKKHKKCDSLFPKEQGGNTKILG